MVAGDLGPTLEPTLTPTPGIVEGSEGCQITEPNRSYYGKTCSYGSIEILASEKVDDRALKQAWNIIANMLAPRPDIAETLSNRGLRVLIYPVGDPYDLPEMLTDGGDNAAGRASDGASPWISTGEGNLLCWSGATMPGYNLLVHELAHQLHFALRNGGDPAFDKTLSALYSDAIDAGKWSGHYAATNRKEYWAEGTTFYFDASPTNYGNLFVNTRAEMQEYDPDLYALIEETFRGFTWSPSCP
jgi:alpha-glucosidase